MAKQPIFPEQSAEVIQAMEEENAYAALDIDPLDTKEREAAPGAFFLSLDEAKLLKRASAVYGAVLTQYLRVNDVEIHTREMQERLRDESKAAIEGAGINKSALIDICRKLKTGHYWTYEIVSIDFSDNSLIYEVTTDREEEPRTITKGSIPDFYEEGKTISEKAAALGIPTGTLYITALDRSQINSISNIYTDEIIPTSPQRLPEIALAPYGNITNAISFNIFMEATRNPSSEMSHRVGNITPIYDEANKTLAFRYDNNGNKQEVVFYNLDAFFGVDTGKKRRGTGDADLRTFCYVMQNIQQQNSWSQYHRHVFINLADMVKNRLGFREDAAYDKLVKMVEKYKTIGFRFLMAENNGQKTTGRGDIFTGDVVRSHGSNIVKITVGENFPVELFIQYTKFPAWAYPLKSNNAFAICQYVFSQMRTNADIVASDDKKLHIIIDKLRETIGIKAPEEVPNRRYKDYIKAPIINAVDEINAAAAQDNTINGYFHIDIVAPNTNDINEWLRGKIEITATGEYTDYLRPLAQTRTAYLEEKKAATIKRNARAAAKRDAHRKK